MISFFKNRVQRYYFLRTQPNKMHKNRPYVHKPFDLCNKMLHSQPLKISAFRSYFFLDWLIISDILSIFASEYDRPGDSR